MKLGSEMLHEMNAKITMELIFHAGNAKSAAMEGIKKAEDGDVEAGLALIQKARTELHEAHQIQTDLITKEIQGEQLEKTILLIHAQDHFMAATLTIDLGERMIQMYNKVLDNSGK
ncbi:PTS lactose/cellobiose transporter subunit IIA [Paenilisteria weihenstephanensis]|nr:PTS lactose/cellobiose transporter subunit IIA [Listeria weihenstephanensis]